MSERTNQLYNLYDYNDKRVVGKYNIPVLKGSEVIPAGLQGFNYMMSKPDYSKGVHFYLDDYQFERMRVRPTQYIKKLLDFPCVLSPDFSLYLDMPIAMQIWNVYRSRFLGQMMESAGIEVIPTVSWSTSESYAFCFDGLPKNSVLSISTIGVKRNKEALKLFQQGISEMIKQLMPQCILCYGGENEQERSNWFNNESPKLQ